jgi:exonuclease VII small subunit
LHCKADRGGALADHADVRRCGEELEQARARVLIVVEAQRQKIVVQLRNNESDDGAQEG